MENPKVPPEAAAPPDRAGLRGTALVHFGPLWDATLEAKRQRGEGPVAVLVCHGMGQQVRYETISSIAQAILDQADVEGGTTSPLQVNLSQGNEGFLARAEVGWTDAGGIHHDVHVYEAYWAPLTEGKVTYWDTVKFLLLAAWNGLRYSHPLGPRTFQRWMFGGPKTMQIGRATFFGLIAVLAFLLAQLAIISFVLLELAQQYKAVIAQPMPVHAGLPFWSHVGELLLAWLHWLGPFFPGHYFLLHPDTGHPRWLGIVMLLGWFVLVAEAFFVRYFIIEYVGDVAAYISPYKDSKFDELRQQIQKVGLDVGKVIYGFGAPQEAVPRYDKIVVVGHSLGSVLAYDTLDALINTDSVSAPAHRRGVVARTRALITFGSPLDKTAFIFRMQVRDSQGWIREQMVASAQPLILDYARYRPAPFEWVNIWSKADIISGELNYYDDPALTPNKPPCVVNMRDPRAWIPFYAHVQYWNNPLLREQLYDFVS